MTSGQAVRTFLFTDIEASTRRWEHDPVAMSEALERHDAVARDAVEANEGSLLKHTGDGVVAVFERPAGALRAAVAMQRGLGDDDVRVRAGIHTGPAEARAGDWFGPTLNRAARVMALGRGGHVLLSATTASAVAADLPDDVTLLDLGPQPLKGFEQPERVHQAVGAGLTSDRALDPRVILDRGRTSFVGRETELDALDRLLDAERCLTITGVGGSGKTRLAVELSRRAAARYTDGVFLVELAAIAEPDEVARAVADAVQMPVVATSIPRDLTIFLRDRECLIVLDNCEHLLDACAELVDELVDGCPTVTLITTSREPLGVDGERSWRAPSLSVPGDDADPLDCESAELFVARATTARPGFVAADHQAAIGTICRGLDGLPLAIELAAARTSHLAPEQIAAMLDDRFRLLTGGARRARQRQQTLQATMDWSHDLLDDDERRLLRRLSVFAGGWTLPAAVDVCGDDDPVAVIDGLGSLAAKSLVVVGEVDGVTRYRMLETVRLYAQERLIEADEATDARDRHRDRYATWVRSTVAVDWSLSAHMQAFEREIDNLRGALDWAREQQRGDVVVPLVSGSWPMWYRSLRSHEALSLLDEFVESIDPELTTGERVEWRIARGFLRQEAMDSATGVRYSHEVLALDPDGSASPMTGLAWFLRMMMPVFLDPPEAVRIGREGIEWTERHSSPELVVWVRNYFGNALVADHRWEEAIPTLQEMLTNVVDDVDDVGVQWTRCQLATAYHLTGDNAAAAAQIHTLLTSLPEATFRHMDTTARALEAIMDAAQGDPTSARAALGRATAVVQRRYRHIPSAIGIPITAAGVVLALEGRDAEALALLVAVGAHGRIWHARQESTWVLHRVYSRTVGERMDADAIERAWTAGEAMTVAEMHAAVDALVAETSGD